MEDAIVTANRGEHRKIKSKMASEKQFWTLKDLCEHASVSHEAVLRMLREPVDPMPALRMGRRWLFEPAKVVAWMKRRADRSRKPRSSIQ